MDWFKIVPRALSAPLETSSHDYLILARVIYMVMPVRTVMGGVTCFHHAFSFFFFLGSRLADSFCICQRSDMDFYCSLGAAGALTAMMIKRLGYAEKYWSLLFTINGGLTGMVRIVQDF